MSGAVKAPLVSWRKRDNASQWLKWDIGVVDEGSDSAEFGFLVWNNYLGSENVPNMEDCHITTKDPQGGTKLDLVTGKWVKVKVDGVDSNFVPIGFNTSDQTVVSRALNSTGTTELLGVTSTPNVAPHESVPTADPLLRSTVSLLGVANDGTKAKSGGNFIELTAKVSVPGVATAGLINFLTRVTYRYV